VNPAGAWWIALAAVAGSLAVVLAVLAAAGHAPATVIAIAAQGALGDAASWAGIFTHGLPLRFALSLQEAGPLLLCGLATAIAFRCGVLNIGVEGQYRLGALAAIAVGVAAPGPGWLALAAAAASGALWAGVAAALERARAVPVVLSTILLNFVAYWLVSLLVGGPLRELDTTAPQTALLGDDRHLPVLVAGTKLHLGVLLAGCAAILLWVVERWTAFGFELRASGLGPDAARLAGIPVARRRAQVMALSGALGGFAGGGTVAGVTYFLTGDAASYGYAGIAVAMLGRLHPLGVAGAAVFFGMLDTASRNLERKLQIPHDLGDCAKGLVVLALLAASAAAAAASARRRGRSAPDESSGAPPPTPSPPVPARQPSAGTA
jgi:simple sugar transport system permease protein